MPDGAFRAGRAPRPFHADLDTPLLDFGGEVWTIRDACEGVQITGAPGSGKSSASARYLRLACFKAGFGGMFACAKVDEAETLIADMKAAGRGDDVVVIDESAAERFNILDFAQAQLGGPGFEGNLVEMMRRMNEAAQVAKPKGGSADAGENSYFVDSAWKWLSHAFPLLLVAEGTIRLKDVARFLASLPQSRDEMKTPEWQAGYCSKVHRRAADLANAGDAYARRIVDEHGAFFLTEVAGLDNRPRSSIESTLTTLIYPFLSGKLAELFCTDTTITPRACRDGALIVLNLPSLRFGPGGAVAQSMFKYLFGLAMQAERVTPHTRPVMLYMDECQHFLSSADADLLATGRSAKCCPVFITQDYPTFYAKMGEQDAQSLLGKFGTRLFHANTCPKTNLAAAEIIYKVQKFYVTESRSSGDSSGGGGSQQDGQGTYQGSRTRSTGTSETLNAYQDYEITPDYFASKLRTGAERNGYKVDAIVVRGGRQWKRTGRHWVQAEFDQRL